MPPAHDQARHDDLELRAARLDGLVARAATAQDAVDAAAKRRFLMLDLEAEGLFEGALHPTLSAALADRPTLRTYRDAAVRLRSYLTSDVRRQFLTSDPPRSLTDSNVSIDWFRFPQPIPDGFVEDEWVAYCEFMMTSLTLHGDGGEILFKVREKLCTVLWRLEDGIHPAIYKATL
jgi:hypothetical protein